MVLPPRDFESRASTNSAIPARYFKLNNREKAYLPVIIRVRKKNLDVNLKNGQEPYAIAYERLSIGK